MKTIGIAAAAGLFASAMLATPAVAAQQEPAQVLEETSASACLQGFSGPYDVVNTYQGITLRCGDPTKGVIHIDQSHPISENGSDDVDVERCMNNILAYGTPTSSGPGNEAKKITNSSGGYAIIAWDASSNDVVTMYTSDSNNWSACAAFG